MKTFPKGGVHPSDNKLSRACAVEVLPLPEVVNVPLAQHIGAPAVAKVAKGDQVKTGQLIAEAAGFSDRFHFTKVFGRVMQMPPAAYRRITRGQGGATKE